MNQLQSLVTTKFAPITRCDSTNYAGNCTSNTFYLVLYLFEVTSVSGPCGRKWYRLGVRRRDDAACSQSWRDTGVCCVISQHRVNLAKVNNNESSRISYNELNERYHDVL